MNPLAALVPDWAKKKKDVQAGKPVELPAGLTLPAGMGPQTPTMNRAMRRAIKKQMQTAMRAARKNR